MTTQALKVNLETAHVRPLALVAGTVRGLAHGFKRWRERSQAIGQLARLDAHTLADIGLDRAEARDILEALLRAREHRAPTLPLV